MDNNTMVYNFENVCKAVELVKKFDFTVSNKAEHFQKCFDIEKLLDELYSLTNCATFIASWSPWDKYATIINNCFIANKKYIKKELDDNLKIVINYIKGEIFDLYNGCISGIYASDYIL